MPLRTMQLLNLFFTKCSTYYAFCEANLPCDKVEERKAFCSSCNGENPFLVFQCLLFHPYNISLSLSLSLSYRYSLISFKSIQYSLCFYATFYFALFPFQAADNNILQTIVTTHAVCKKLKFKRVLTLSLRMTDACQVLISMLEPCNRMSLFCSKFYKISEGKVFYTMY